MNRRDVLKAAFAIPIFAAMPCGLLREPVYGWHHVFYTGAIASGKSDPILALLQSKVKIAEETIKRHIEERLYADTWD